MCIKAGNSEISSVKALMTMSLKAIVGEVFGLEPEEIVPGLQVFSDLRMTADQESEFADLVAEYFDGLKLKFNPTTTLGDVFDYVVEPQFEDVPADVL